MKFMQDIVRQKSITITDVLTRQAPYTQSELDLAKNIEVPFLDGQYYQERTFDDMFQPSRNFLDGRAFLMSAYMMGKDHQGKLPRTWRGDNMGRFDREIHEEIFSNYGKCKKLAGPDALQTKR
uniref:Uncharacterized protein n=1 Tax=Cucumis melo TaxID=3656 RepID=A0A9I9ELT6_CUCME